SSTTINECGSYTWNGTTYTESGTYTYSTLNETGCDSIASLELTILNPSDTSLVVEACQNYTLPWGTSVSESGTYSNTYTNASGCDSLVFVIAQIHPGQTELSYSVSECNPYNLPWGGIVTASGSYSYSYSDQNGCDSIVTADVTIGCVTLDLKLYIQGFYTGGGWMNNHNVGGCLFVDGLSMDSADADTVFVSAMNSGYPFDLVDRQAAILKTDGNLRIVFGDSVKTGIAYYLRITHRNSLETWSAAPVLMTANTNYDFSSAAAKAYGDNLADLGDGKFGLYSGDINQDGIIESGDYSAVENSSQVFLSGYFADDLTGDGLVESTDYSLIENNSQLFLITSQP
ncbi:MAG TPA: hypothetical protein PLU53_09935, partial [Bacteroidia bacterium]|nr:hypothetical protein [Bacteroidia bacterium]